MKHDAPRIGQRGSRLAHLSLLEQNVIGRVGSATRCEYEPGLWRTALHSFTRQPECLSALSEPATKFSPIQERAVRLQRDPGPVSLIPASGRLSSRLAPCPPPNYGGPGQEQQWSRPTVATRGNLELCPQEPLDRQVGRPYCHRFTGLASELPTHCIQPG